MIPAKITEVFTGGSSQAEFVEKVSQVTGYRWSRPSLTYMLNYGIVTAYETITKKKNAERPRLLLGYKAFVEVLIFMLIRESLLFMSRGSNPNEKDPSQKSSKKNDTAKYKLAGHALKLLKQEAHSNFSDISQLASKLKEKLADSYMLSSNYCDCTVSTEVGKIDKTIYNELKSQFIKVVLLTYFFSKLLSDGYFENKQNIDVDWDFLMENVLDKKPLVNEVHELYRNNLLSGCNLLTKQNFMDGVKAFCFILQDRQPKIGKPFKYTAEQKNQLVTLSQLACRYDTSTHFMSLICHQLVARTGITELNSLEPEYFVSVSRLVFSSSNLLPYPSKMRGSNKFI